MSAVVHLVVSSSSHLQPRSVKRSEHHNVISSLHRPAAFKPQPPPSLPSATWKIRSGLCAPNSKPRSVAVRNSSDDTPFPFCSSDYIAVKILAAPYGPMRPSDKDGLYVLPLHKVEDSDSPSEAAPCMEVLVGGDTARSLLLLLEQQRSERPMAIELLWKVLQRGMAVSNKEWRLLRVAVVGVINQAYIARLFFGDPDSGEVAWDCDCRPSDGVWLALTCGAPILVRRCVWTEYAVALRDTQIFKMEQVAQKQQVDSLMSSPWTFRSGTTAWRPRPRGRGSPLGTDIEIEDPEEIKLLKREMEVAVSEEDYGRAKVLREHPYMRLYTEMRRMYLEGAEDEAGRLQRRLSDMIQENQRFGVDRGSL